MEKTMALVFQILQSYLVRRCLEPQMTGRLGMYTVGYQRGSTCSSPFEVPNKDGVFAALSNPK